MTHIFGTKKPRDAKGDRFTLQQLIERARAIHTQHLDFLCEAFIQETGCHPSELMLVQGTANNRIFWYFAKRSDYVKDGQDCNIDSVQFVGGTNPPDSISDDDGKSTLDVV